MSTDYTEFESKMKKTASVLTEQYDSCLLYTSPSPRDA